MGEKAAPPPGRALAPPPPETSSAPRLMLMIRVGAATALLIPVAAVQAQLRGEISLFPLFVVIGLAYAGSLLAALLLRVSDGERLTPLQLVFDLGLVTALTFLMGGARSPIVILYLLVALGAGLTTSRSTALALAALAGVSYGLVANLVETGLLAAWDPGLVAPGPPIQPSEMVLRVASLLLSTVAVAWISSAYSRRLHRAHMELRQERLAREAVQKLNQQVLAGMSSGLVAADNAGLTIACNPAAERILQRTEYEMVSRPAAALLGLEPRALQDLERRLDERQIFRTEREIRLPSGEYRQIGMSVTKVQEGEGSGEPLERPKWQPKRASDRPWAVPPDGPMAGGYIFMFQDLTEIKRLERVFWMRERMALLGEMAGSLAHEIRNPLASISGSLQMLRRSDAVPDHPSAGELMDIVTRESERLSRIIDEFLDYARADTLQATEADLVTLARETVALMSNSPELGPHHRLDVETTAAEVPAVVDPGKIKQVFWNLARNAVQAMPDGGGLEIRLSREATGARVVFEDQGSGMDSEQLESVFRPFVSDSAGGTGLGLSVVYRILEQHGARIEVESEVGKGTRFVMTFPTPDMHTGDEPGAIVDESEGVQLSLITLPPGVSRSH